MLNLIVNFGQSPLVNQIMTEDDRALANNIAMTGGEELWYDSSRISEGVIVWAVPGAGWARTFHRGERVVVLPCREDGSPTSFASLNEEEVGFGRPTISQHWHVLRPCLVSR